MLATAHIFPALPERQDFSAEADRARLSKVALGPTVPASRSLVTASMMRRRSQRPMSASPSALVPTLPSKAPTWC